MNAFEIMAGIVPGEGDRPTAIWFAKADAVKAAEEGKLHNSCLEQSWRRFLDREFERLGYNLCEYEDGADGMSMECYLYKGQESATTQEAEDAIHEVGLAISEFYTGWVG